MQIILEEDEIKAALVAYATSMITIKDDQEISIDMKAGRGENGYSATLNVQPKAAPVKATRARTTAEAAQVTKPVAVPATPAKALFSKPTPVAEESVLDAIPDEPVAAISTGEERVDPSETVNQDVDASVEPDPQPEGIPAEKPKSIFNFAKPAANG